MPRIFGFDGELASKITHVNWLSSMLKGLNALEFYDAEKEKWGQVRTNYRYNYFTKNVSLKLITALLLPYSSCKACTQFFLTLPQSSE